MHTEESGRCDIVEGMADMAEGSIDGVDDAVLVREDEPVWDAIEIGTWWTLLDNGEAEKSEVLDRFVKEMWRHNPDAVADVVLAQGDFSAGAFLGDPRTPVEISALILNRADTVLHPASCVEVKALAAESVLLPDDVKTDFLRTGKLAIIDELVSRGALTKNMMLLVLDEICTDRGQFSQWVVQSFAENPNTDPELLERFSRGEYLERFVTPQPMRMRGIVAANPSTPARVLHRMVGEESRGLDFADIISAVAGNPSAEPATLVDIFSREGQIVRTRSALASNPHTPAHVLDVIADDPSNTVSVVVNSNVAEGTILRVLRNPPEGVERAAVAWAALANRNIYAGVEEELLAERNFNDGKKDLMFGFVTKEAISLRALERLAGHPQQDVSRTAQTRLRLCGDREAEVRFLIKVSPWIPESFLCTPSAPPGVLAEYADRKTVALNHPSCPLETVARLTVTSSDRWWRQEAAKVLWRRTRIEGETLPG